MRGLAVIKLQEAFAIRDAGITAPVLLMGPFEPGDLPELHARDIMPMVYTNRCGSVAGARRPLNQDSCLHRYRAWARVCRIAMRSRS